MPHRETDTVSISASDYIASGLRYGFSRQALLHALEEIAPETAKSGSSSVFTLTMDYSQTKAAMIAAGKYDYVNDFLKNNDPVEGNKKGTGVVEVALELVHFNRVISTPDALKEIKKMGRELAHLEHLLALGAKHPNLQKEFPIVALGSLWQSPDGRRSVACLDRWSDERELNLYWDDGDWYEHCRFLAVRK